MIVEVFYIAECPNHHATTGQVREELKALNLQAEVREIEVRDQAAAEECKFIGSPTVRINGLDIEPDARNSMSFGLSCRTYVGDGGRTGMPSRSVIRKALLEQMNIERGECTPNAGCCAASAEPERRFRGSEATRNRVTAGTLTAGGLAAILASTCCLGPLLLVTLGISGAWIANLTLLEPYRPLFIGIAVAALYFGGRRIYRPVQACQPDEVCALPQTRLLYRLLFWIGCALTLLALTFPYFLKYFY